MKRTKSELLQDLENMTLEKDIEYDRAETLQNMNMNTHRALQTLETIKSIVDQMRIAKERLDAGILTDKELFDSLLDTLLYDVEMDNIPLTEKES